MAPDFEDSDPDAPQNKNTSLSRSRSRTAVSRKALGKRKVIDLNEDSSATEDSDTEKSRAPLNIAPQAAASPPTRTLSHEPHVRNNPTSAETFASTSKLNLEAVNGPLQDVNKPRESTSQDRSAVEDPEDKRWQWDLEPVVASTSKLSSAPSNGKRAQREDSIELISDHPPKARKLDWHHLTDFTTLCRGLKFHKGANTLKLNSPLTLQRNKANFDKNCIMAYHKGEKTGYLPPGICSKLAPLMDANKITMTGKCCKLEGPPGTTAARLAEVSRSISIWGHPSLKSDPSLAFLFKQSGNASAKKKSKDKTNHEIDEEEELDEQFLAEQAEKKAEARRKQRAIDAFDSFFGASARDVAQLPTCPQPKGDGHKLKTQLLKHQLQALRWMAQMEHPRPPKEGEEPVQLWTYMKEENGSSAYLNLGTQESKAEMPRKLARGGILADDMGLGKTLSMLALIRSRPTGKGVLENIDEPLNPKFDNPTLIVCPMSVMQNWTEQIRSHIGGDMMVSYHVYHGKDKQVTVKALTSVDIVITTFQTVVGDYVLDTEGNPVRKKDQKRATSRQRNGPLYEVRWRRIVLDEAHQARNPKAMTSRACCDLIGERRWALTGTPLINRPKDLGALVTFTRLCKPFHDPAVWTQKIEKAKDKERSAGLLRAIVQSTTLRRTKETKDASGNPIVALPRIRFFEYKVELDQETRDLYNAVAKAVKRRVKDLAQKSQLTKNYSNVLVYMLRLRQLACARDLCPQDFIDAALAGKLHDQVSSEAKSKSGLSKAEEQILQMILYENRNEECTICFDTMDEPRITICKHFFCATCINQVLDESSSPTCPMCRQSITRSKVLSLPEGFRPDEEDYGESACRAAKAKELIRLLRRSGPTVKSLVFSQWSSHLRRLKISLDENNITSLQIDGSLSRDQRDDIISRFHQADGPQVLMLTGAGAVGLNLKVANQVFLMDPWWQDQIEQQAIDRCHRIGQDKECYVFQLVVADTIEDRVLNIQKDKNRMITDAFSGTKGAVHEREKQQARFRDIAAALGMDADTIGG